MASQASPRADAALFAALFARSASPASWVDWSCLAAQAVLAGDIRKVHGAHHGVDV